MLTAVRAELLDLEPVGIVAAVLFGDVVAVLAHFAGQGDLGPHISTGGHVNCSLSSFVCVAVGGLDPPTSRL